MVLCGCTPGGGIWQFVYPEQRSLDIRDPGQLPQVHLPEIPPPATVSRPPPTDTPSLLSLDEAIRVALENSKVVRVFTGVSAASTRSTIYDAAISNTLIDEAQSAFDPSLVIRNNFNRNNSPSAFSAPGTPSGVGIDGPQIDTYDLGIGLSKPTVFGGKASLDFANDLSKTYPALSPLNPQDRSSVTLSYTQPLLQGAGIAPNVAPIVIARINTERSYFQFKDSVQDLVFGVIEAYWSVVFARTDLWARQQQVEQGEFAYALASARLKAGLGNAAQVAQAKVALSNFRANLIAAEASLLQQEAALRNILGLPPLPDRLVPTSPPTTGKIEPIWQEIVRLAEERRPDLIELKLVLEADRQSLVLAQNQAQPRLDGTMLYRWNGLEGETPSSARVSSGAGQFTDWTLGVNFSVPLGLRQSRAGLRRAELVLARDQAYLEQGFHKMSHDLAASLRSLALDFEQYRAFQDVRKAARENLDAQMADFKNGRTIFLNVLEAISNWGNSVSSEARTLTQYNNDLANLEKQTGTILETHGVRFMEERFAAIGPLGRLAEPQCYPRAVPPGPNSDRYPTSSKPAEEMFELTKPSLPTDAKPTPESLRPPVPMIKPPTIPEPRAP